MKNEQSAPFDYPLARQQVKEQLCSGKSQFGKDGAFAPLLQEMLNLIPEGEIEGHLDEKTEKIKRSLRHFQAQLK